MEHVIDKRPQADRLLIAGIWGEARHRARWHELAAEEEAAAVAAVSELAGGRADLLAEVAGVLEGTSEGEMDEPLARQAAMLCRKAEADPDAIPGWIETGRERQGERRAAAVLRIRLADPAAEPEPGERAGGAGRTGLAGGVPRVLTLPPSLAAMLAAGPSGPRITHVRPPSHKAGAGYGG